MKKFYEEPCLENIYFQIEDVIATSIGGGIGGDNETDERG